MNKKKKKGYFCNRMATMVDMPIESIGCIFIFKTKNKLLKYYTDKNMVIQEVRITPNEK